MSATSNPYVGLRPFRDDENLLFFGRDDQTLELLQRLHHNRFVAVVGSSGCGKSSLIKAGLIPALKGGYLVEDSSKWIIVPMKPGQSPMYNLAHALLTDLDDKVSKEDVLAFITSIKKKGVSAIVERIKPLKEKDSANFFLLVDQFEELFRFSTEVKDPKYKTEAIDFVNTILKLAEQAEVHFHVVLTMRSDFIGDCTQFQGLPEAMNKSQYLVPKLSRRELHKVIENPAKLFGVKFSPILTSRLLNDLGKVKDELPLIQHALMRMWDHEMKVDKSGELDLDDYKAIGGIEKALSQHADEALQDLKKGDIQIVKEMFQALTATDENGRKIRRPAFFSDLVALTKADKNKLDKIIALFNADGRSFLMSNEVGSSGDRLIDISHESLIRQWDTLGHWVDEEGDAASYYLQLAEASRLHRAGKKDFLSGSELHLALEWRERFKPSAVWANRYKAGFEESITYLNNSEEEHDRLLALEAKRKKKVKLLIGGIIGVLLVSGAYATWSAFKIDGEKKTAVKNEEKALASEAKEKAALIKAKNSALAFEQAFENSKKQEGIANAATKKAMLETFKARKEKAAADSARKQIIEEKAKANIQSNALILSFRSKEFSNNPTLALLLNNEALKILDSLSSDKDMQDIPRREMQKLRASSAFFNPNSSLAEWMILSINGDIELSAPQFSISAEYILDLDTYKLYENNSWSESGSIEPHTGDISALAFSDDGNVLTGYEDGFAWLWDINGNLLATFEGEHTNTISTVAFSPKEEYVLTGGLDSLAVLWDIMTGKPIARFKGHTGGISQVAYDPNFKRVATVADDGDARIWNLGGKCEYKLYVDREYASSVAFSPDGKRLAAGASKPTFYMWNIENLEKKENMSINGDPIPPDEKFRGHDDEISCLEFSPDGQNILSGSLDGTAILWDLKGEIQTRFLGLGSIITEIGFSKDERFIYTSVEGLVFEWVWPGSPNAKLKLEEFINCCMHPDFLKEASEIAKEVIDGNHDYLIDD